MCKVELTSPACVTCGCPQNSEYELQPSSCSGRKTPRLALTPPFVSPCVHSIGKLCRFHFQSISRISPLPAPLPPPQARSPQSLICVTALISWLASLPLCVSHLESVPRTAAGVILVKHESEPVTSLLRPCTGRPFSPNKGPGTSSGLDFVLLRTVSRQYRHHWESC